MPPKLELVKGVNFLSIGPTELFVFSHEIEVEKSGLNIRVEWRRATEDMGSINSNFSNVEQRMDHLNC
ncbi:hypothetical protein Ahy_A03g013369 isoform E [Arachis hypogaea]|uniref:Uncharacterized protein n=1 Tax=Arachis hypogaea TaxID=3818 RepID=A0A445DV86_ARAHY|nr:hypothetical protein Ahy_A03g013369 isoform E [Arachis hypogaea]